MKYKVTRRGWIVLFIMLFIVIASIVSLFSNNDITGLEESANTDIEADNISDTENNAIEESTDTVVEETATETTEVEVIEETEGETDEVEVTEETEGETDEVEVTEETKNETDEVEDVTEADEVTSDSEGTTESEEQVVTSVYDYEEYELSIYFGKNTYDLESDYAEKLNELKLMIESDLTKKIVIEGHINGYPLYDDGVYGLNISSMRADVVRGFLTNLGISDDNIIVINKGSSDQIDMSDDTEKHYLNRRAYIYFEIEGK